MSDEKQAMKRLLTYALNELESIGVEIDHPFIKADGKTLVEWCHETDRYEATDD